MRSFWRGRNLIGLSCLLALAACATTPPTPTTSDAAAATVTEAESVAPAVSSIVFRGSPARDDTYGLGETVEVRVRFDSPVTATGKPRMALTIGTQTRHATLSSWSRQSLYFTYTVQEDDRDEDGISIAPNALLLNGGTIKSADGTTDVDLSHGAVAAARGNKVNGSDRKAPKVRDISFRSAPARGGTYELGEIIEVRFEFDKAVTATGKPQVALNIGTQTRHATFFAWGREALYFTYAVQEDDRDEDGISIAPNALALNGGTIKSADGTIDADLTHRAVAAERRRKVNGSDSSPPGVRDIAFNSSPARGDTFGLGETVEVRVEFDRAVKATGSPQVALTIGERMRHATLSAWSPQSMHFEYTVLGPDRDEDGISIPANALIVNGGTIKSADGTTDADLTHGPVADRWRSKVNGGSSMPPGVRNISFISSPARAATYGLGETIEVRVEFDSPVTVTGSPKVALTIGSQTRQAVYSPSWRGPRYAHFSYAVQEGDRDDDGISIAANALALNEGTISHAAAPKVDADLAHNSVPADPGRKVDGSRVTP